MPKCNGCEFGKPAHEGKLWCVLANDFAENLDGFCPKELDIEKIKQKCEYYLPTSKNLAASGMCRAPFHGHDHYDLCWVKSFEDLLRDPDFTLVEHF
jgi:hypothetical protein